MATVVGASVNMSDRPVRSCSFAPVDPITQSPFYPALVREREEHQQRVDALKGKLGQVVSAYRALRKRHSALRARDGDPDVARRLLRGLLKTARPTADPATEAPLDRGVICAGLEEALRVLGGEDI